MPIILLWNATVAGALAQFGRWFDSFERSTFLIERWLEKRVRATEDLERLTIRFPVIRFYNEAVSAQVGRFHFGALLDAPVAGVGAHIERALGQWNVARRVSAAQRENRLLPELFRVLEEITVGIVASIDRFRDPTAATFDPSRTQASDIVGLAVLAFRAVTPNQARILRAAKTVRDAFVTPPTAEAGDTPSGAGGTSGATAWAGSALPFEVRADEVARYLVAGILIIPTIGRLLVDMGSDLLLHLRYELLDLFQGIEGQAFGFRRRVLRLFVVDLDVYARQGLLLLLTVREVAVGYIQFYARVGVEYLRGVIGGVSAFASQLQTFWSGLVRVIHNVLGFGNGFIAIDVGRIVHHALVSIQRVIENIDRLLYTDDEHPKPYKAPRQFPVTIEELVMGGGGPGSRVGAELFMGVSLLTDAWNGASRFRRVVGGLIAYGAINLHIPNLILGLQGVVVTLALPRAGAPNQPTLTFAPGTIPDLNAVIIQPLREGATRAINDAVTGVAGGIERVVVVVTQTLDATADAFENAAARASRMSSLQLLQRLTSNTDALIRSLFAGQAPGGAPTGLEPLAGAYAQALIQGGFDTIGAAMAGFVGMVLDEWVVHLSEGRDTPVEITATSPRKLLARARLGRVHTPELRIIAREQALGRPLAARIADRFQIAVQNAYELGQTRLNQALEAAP